MKRQIENALKKATGLKDVEVDVPERQEHGDYSSNISLTMFAGSKEILRQDFGELSRTAQDDKVDSRILSTLSNVKGNTPKELAEVIVEILKKDKELMELVEKIEVAGPGFVNFYLSRTVLVRQLLEIQKKDKDYGKSMVGKGKTAIIEYSSPNIAKPFTVGHLRSTIIGDAIANLYEATGWKVYRDNHLGDWGTQFGKQIYAIKKWGDVEEIAKSQNPVRELVTLYVKFHQEAEKDPSLEDKAREWFKKLEQGDGEARSLWKKCIEWSWREFEKIYETLGVSFSEEFNDGRGLGEAFFEDKMPAVIKELEDKGFLKEGKEGAKLVFFKQDKYPPAMIVKKDGTTLYHTRDLATDKYRLDNYDPDLVINEVGAEQTLYFQQLFEMENMLGWYKKGQRVHLAHGLIRFKDRKMSTRKGEVVWLEEVLEQAIDKAKSLSKDGVDEELAGTVGIGALKYNDLKRDPKTEIVFDWDEVLNMEGNSGPYLQYTAARANSVLRKAELSNSKLQTPNNSTIEQLNNEEFSLLRSFVHFPEAVQGAAENFAPNRLCNYLFDLAQKFNTFYNAHRILEQEGGRSRGWKSRSEFRLALTAAVGTILTNGLNLLGIQAPEKM